MGNRINLLAKNVVGRTSRWLKRLLVESVLNVICAGKVGMRERR
jgi:hypothetical protein